MLAFGRATASATLVGVVLLACGDGSETTDDGSSNGGATIGTGTTTSASGGTVSSGGAGSSNGAGAGSGAALYAEPDAIVGGPCEASPTAVSPPCSGAAEQSYCRLDDPSDVIMAVCPAYGLDQCEAMDACESGWHACTATDYVARGGRDVPPDLSSATDRAWLAACVQDLGSAPQLRNEPCSYCGDTDFSPVVEWWCDGEVVYEGGMAGTTLGVLATPECMRVGTNDAANAAYWGMAFTTDAPSFVVCCLDAL